MEEVMELLAEVQQTIPQMMGLLDDKDLLALSALPSDPFKDDEDFLSSMHTMFALRKYIWDMQKKLKHVVLAVGDGREVASIDNFKAHKAVLNQLANHIHVLIKSRLNIIRERNGLLPRILRYAEKVPLNEKETEMLVFFMVVHIGEIGYPKLLGEPIIDGFQTTGTWGNTPLIGGFMCGLSVKELVEFLALNRLHIKQSLFDSSSFAFLEGGPRGSQSVTNPLRLNAEAIKVFLGAKLTSDEQLKIDKTLISDVLAQEGPLEIPIQNGALVDQKISIPPVVPLDSDIDIIAILQEEKNKEKVEREELEAKTKAAKEEKGDIEPKQKEDDPDEIKPYKTDLDYLDDHFKLLATKIKVQYIKANPNQFDAISSRSDATIRQSEAKIRALAAKVERRMQKTQESSSWTPRLERLAIARKLDQNEKNIILLLIGYVIVPEPEFHNFKNQTAAHANPSVNELIRALCSTLEDQVNFRVYFYKGATLVREGIVKLLNSGLQGDLIHSRIEIDRRMLDFTVGLDTEFSEVVEGSHLYYPKVLLDSVVLPAEQKQLILNSVSHFANYKKWQKTMGFDEVISYGNGMVLLFYGPSGTGKTMMANSVANHLQKKVLLINFPSLGSMSAGENFKFIFREAKINDAILFFDECESIFESREKGNYDVNMLLTEFERHDGLIILATNRPHDLDEAMHRRITLTIEFKKPDHILREAIWKSLLPKKIKLAKDIDWKLLALKYELTGGFIKNAILSALSLAVSRDGDNPEITRDDLVGGAKLQLRGRLQMKSFERRVVPMLGVDDCILDEEVTQYLYEIVNSEKARSVLFGQWGFGKHMNFHQGTTVLFHGPPGTGKSLAAEAIGYEIGQPLKVVNCAELLSKWVGETGKNIEAIFEEARTLDAVLLFDEAEGIFGQRSAATSSSSDRYANVDTGLLLYHMEKFSGVVILTTNMLTNIQSCSSPKPMEKFDNLEFPIPKPALRAKLWRAHIPKEAPVADNIDFDTLAKKFEFAGGNIKNSVFKAASRAALRSGNMCISMEDFTNAANEELKKMKGDFGSGHIYT